ncbi:MULTISPECIES: vitamin K epoxide reductase family protein [unclassified Sphingobacterium]|uniref:vitamin K epoxide reductase family protein n=1 Tax=unclassified Sphingobacterium TaxID=2609468 RepID=UPI00104C3AEF|nr:MULTISPECIES: vitamin K epoxide reductase family protein [unclassified Sphingobacterium]MCS3554284.1 protein-disulfide isomerase/uncharacterized membrane protein [Sphingobacterium sp. JUb21]
MIFFSSIRQLSESNLLHACNYVLNIFSVKNSKYQLNKLIESHLESNSLLAVKEILQEYGIESVAIRKGDYSYSDFETPFIVSIQQEGWSNANFAVVTETDDQYLYYLEPIKNTTKKISFTEFGNIDKGIILLLDDATKKDEKDYAVNRKDERIQSVIKNIPIYLILFTILISSINILSKDTSITSWIGLSFLLSSFIGLTISTILLWHEVDAHNPFIKEVCGGSGKKMNCDAVLSSAKASFLGVSWSTWGFAFMATLFFTQIIYAGQLNQLLVSSYISIIVSPYIFFSIYYQGLVVKQWCPLCLVTQIILAINAILGFVFINMDYINIYQIDYYSIVTTIFLGILFLVTSYFAVPMLKSANDSRGYAKKWKKLRYNPIVFQAMLDNSEAITISTENLGILVGNLKAKHEIIKVCNPYCGPCSKAHPELEEIIKKNSDVKIRIIFTASGKEDDKATAPVAHLLAIQQQLGCQAVHNALDDWYLDPRKDYSMFADKYPVDEGLKKQDEKISAMRDWCDKMKVRATPTLYINGKELPDHYSIMDLKNFF